MDSGAGGAGLCQVIQGYKIAMKTIVDNTMSNADLPIHHRSVKSPVGMLMLAASPEALVAIEFERDPHPVARTPAWCDGSGAHPVLDAAQTQLAQYFDGARQRFDLPLAPSGTAFQKRVWQALREIPYGQTWSYGQLAARLGNAKAMRAVGAANGRNPISIVIPCHRVIGANGSLVGFGGGLPVKRQLLALEQPGLWDERRQQTPATHAANANANASAPAP